MIANGLFMGPQDRRWRTLRVIRRLNASYDD